MSVQCIFCLKISDYVPDRLFIYSRLYKGHGTSVPGICEECNTIAAQEFEREKQKATD